MNLSTPSLPVHHQLPEFSQTHAHRIGDAIQPSHPLSSPSLPAPNPSQHQDLLKELPDVKARTLADSQTEANLCSVDSPWRTKDATVCPPDSLQRLISVRRHLPPQHWQCDPLAAPRTRQGACRHERARPLTLGILGPANPSLPAQAHPRALR